MKIAYIAPGYPPAFGGVERHVAEIARRVAARGHQVHVLCPTRARGPRDEVIDGVHVRRFRDINRFGIYSVPPALFADAARLTGYDVIHAHSYHALPSLAGLLARRAPLVFTPHYHGTGHSPVARLAHVPYRPVGRALFRRARAVVCVSEAERRLIAADVPAVRDRLEVIPNGVDVRAIRESAPYPNRGLIVLSIGRLEPYKQVDRLIAALPYAPPASRLVIVGTGSAASSLARQAAAAGVSGRVTFAGRVDDDGLRRWLRSSTVVASLSREEAFGIVLVEGLAAGAAVVASSIEAHREVLDRQELAVLVPPDGSAEAIGAAIGDAVALREQPHEPAHVEDWDDVTDRTIAIYERLSA